MKTKMCTLKKKLPSLITSENQLFKINLIKIVSKPGS